jgi:predicted molibdopterin-dependent oxidoreductase YjgC
MSDTAVDFSADYYLALERPLFHAGTLSRRSPALMKICPEPTLRISETAAEKIGLEDGEQVEFSTALGSATIAVTLDESIKDNKMLLSNTFSGKGAYGFLNYTLDPVTKAPGTEGCEIKIQKR